VPATEAFQVLYRVSGGCSRPHVDEVSMCRAIVQRPHFEPDGVLDGQYRSY
jgi:hypothetical protein